MTSGPRRTHKPWFGPKRVGWGISPATWQGWVVVVVAAAILVVVVHAFAG